MSTSRVPKSPFSRVRPPGVLAGLEREMGRERSGPEGFHSQDNAGRAEPHHACNHLLRVNQSKFIPQAHASPCLSPSSSPTSICDRSS